MKTPVEELFELLWDTPKDKFTWYAIRKRFTASEGMYQSYFMNSPIKDGKCEYQWDTSAKEK